MRRRVIMCELQDLLVWQMVFVLASTSCDILIVTPNVREIVEPIGTQVMLNCSVLQGNPLGTSWEISIPMDTLTSRNSLSLGELPVGFRGFEAIHHSNVFIQLVINGTQDNNWSSIECREVFPNGTACLSDSITAQFFGPPSNSTIFAISINGAGSLNISWSLDEGVQVEFDLVLINLNNSRTLMATTRELSHVITLRDNTSCDLYNFRVIARNRAGNSTSDIVTSTFPSLPEIVAVEYSVAEMMNGVVLNVTIRATSCPDYPVQNYTIVLDDLQGSRMRVSVDETMGSWVIGEIMLEGNSQYMIHVEVTNEVGAVKYTPVQISTSEVQAVNFTRLDEDIFSIQCIYLSGSVVRECVYTIVSRQKGVDNITGSICGNDSVTLEIANIGCYSNVLAHANTTGALPVGTRIDTDEECPFTKPSTTMGLPNMAGSGDSEMERRFPVRVIVAVVATAVVAVVLVLAGVGGFVVCRAFNKRRFSQDLVKSSGVTCDGFGINKSTVECEIMLQPTAKGVGAEQPCAEDVNECADVVTDCADGEQTGTVTTQHYKVDPGLSLESGSMGVAISSKEQEVEETYSTLNQPGSKTAAAASLELPQQGHSEYSELCELVRSEGSSEENAQYSTVCDSLTAGKTSALFNKRPIKKKPAAASSAKLQVKNAESADAGLENAQYSTVWHSKTGSKKLVAPGKNRKKLVHTTPASATASPLAVKATRDVSYQEETVTGQEMARSPDIVPGKRLSNSSDPLALSPASCPAGGDSPIRGSFPSTVIKQTGAHPQVPSELPEWGAVEKRIR